MLDITTREGVTELRLNRPPVNALDPALVTRLRTGIEEAVAEGAQGLLLTGNQGMFSAGLDVPTLLTLDRDGMRAFWREFFALCATLARLPIPSVAAISGHSPAGGAVLALFCDYRVMARGPFRIGLNEVQVGLTVPDCIQLALRRVVGAYRAERLLVAGTMLTAEEALACGFVDELTPVEEVTVRAQHWMHELLALPQQAMRSTRALARADLADAFADLDALPVEDFLDGWFSEETQGVMKALVAQLKSKK
ncbi:MULTISPECIES: enoyl-CoA hydratase/isomerase family protein [Oleiagrimonas]|jgi:Delta3-Delta2-enoyl-CoA isomerase|uniref:Enoyl-CoA hydratase/isomerase family protein n=1 Tax=Oleiagrimonas citrea TaxID=1665687 RepID=A0A846ZFV0_9GAMM|nr:MULTISPECIES: enoyl-CoA hydratase/isomerase family protein [Oleiagrimonas]NKZ37785.1 enoyl-CoA hydratase/isomerase family protein [Oleiagrimonas citrea]RAP57294.1 enoyl-CoA hydratase [Oleiagrimonas sp. MCCC 1A03011]